MAIVFICVWTLIARTVLASVSIEVEPLLIEFGKSGVDISCVVNGTNLLGISSIQLKRSESNVVAITKFKISWKDKALENKTGVTVNASINNTMTSYLRLEISKTVVRYPEDMGSYQCILSAVTASGEIKQYRSQSIVLNITEFLESTTKLFPTTNHKSTEASVQKDHKTILRLFWKFNATRSVDNLPQKPKHHVRTRQQDRSRYIYLPDFVTKPLNRVKFNFCKNVLLFLFFILNHSHGKKKLKLRTV